MQLNCELRNGNAFASRSLFPTSPPLFMSRKRQRLESSAGNSSRETTSPPTLGFITLPVELKQMIVELACSHDLRACDDDGGPVPVPYNSSLPDLDTSTLLELTLVNRELHQLTQALQYQRIELTTSSALYELHRTLTIHPELGALIRNLYIGPQGALPCSWWPLFVDVESYVVQPPHSYIMSFLPHYAAPKACQRSGRESTWPVDAPANTCMEAAVAKALQVAMHSVDAALIENVRNKNQDVVESAFKLQAMLDLYLLEVKRREDARNEEEEEGAEEEGETSCSSSCSNEPPENCLKAECGHYPPLEIADPSEQQPPGSCESARPVVITRSQLLSYMTPRGAVTDRLDHPLLFSRSGLGMSYQGVDEIAFEDDLEDCANWPRLTTHWSKEARIDLSAFLRNGCQEVESEGSIDIAAGPKATLKSTLLWGRSVLSHATNVENLSLTGHLEQVTRSGLELASVKKCTIGPPPAFLMLTELDLSCLPNVEQLRLCGTYISHAEAECISGRMPRLRRLVWSVLTYQGRREISYVSSRRRPCQGPEEKLVQTIRSLLRYDHAAVGFDASSSQKEESAPLVEVRLHRTDLVNTLTLKPDWVEAQPFRERGRRGQLLLTESAAAQDIPIESIDEETSRLWEAHYEEGREWWRGNAK